MDRLDRNNNSSLHDGRLETNQSSPPPGYEAFLKNTSFILHSFVDMAIKAAQPEKKCDTDPLGIKESLQNKSGKKTHQDK